METLQGSLRGAPAPTQEERTWAMVAHLSALLAAFTGLPFLGPLVVMLVKGRTSGWVRAQAVEALNFQLTVFIALVVCSVLLCLGIGIVLLPLVGAAALVLSVVAGVKASHGDFYRYPATLRLIS